jgi:hypothetical protein
MFGSTDAARVLVNVHRVRINTLALGARLPTIYAVREYVEAGRMPRALLNFEKRALLSMT